MCIRDRVEVAYFEDPPEGVTASEAPASMLIPTWILIGANIYFGIDASLTTRVGEAAARALLGLAS